MPTSARLTQFYQDYRHSMTALSYRLTGSWSEAEDIVQDVFAELQQNVQADPIRQPKSYLMRAVVNRSLTALKSPRLSRETYTGPWLPEPVFEPPPETQLDRLLREEQVSYAFMVLLERLTPDERTVFVLRESFAMEYEEIADILGKSEVACRKLLSRARQKVKAEPEVAPADEKKVAKWTREFLKAAKTGDFGPLLEIIREDAVLISDGGGKVRAAINPIVSRERIMAFWQGIQAKGSLAGEWAPTVINGELGLVHYREGRVAHVFIFEGDTQGRIQRFYMIGNPDKISRAPRP
ncbi:MULTISPECIES: RNA polymerase sigma factor SigJ [Paenibacillus]|uniref:RNA polymerase sigma factor SigJ n=1 Tax=Paenibacillus TaxID=44249 RepID=UPI00073EA388|nr:MULTISPECIES: RNA polymerase sigma factor SigJ [Paenibacillus]MDU4695259.1 RNA polymerase sigma factor SigJ [Paenibacillus sp.]